MNIRIPDSTKEFLNDAGHLSRFIWRFVSEGLRPRYELGEFVRQCYVVGYKSLAWLNDDHDGLTFDQIADIAEFFKDCL